MDLTARFAKVATSNVVSVETLQVGRRYPVTRAQRQETHYGLAILLTLWIDPTKDVKVYLPKRFTDVFLDSDIELINNGNRAYHLVFHGRYPKGRSYKLTLENGFSLEGHTHIAICRLAPMQELVPFKSGAAVDILQYGGWR